MPTESNENEDVYVDGEKLCFLSDIDITPLCDSLKQLGNAWQEFIEVFAATLSDEMRIEFDYVLQHNAEEPSNNWRKLHHIPMSRRWTKHGL